LRRRSPFKFHPHGDAVVEREAGNLADAHLARQAAAPGHAVARHAPQWCHARKQHEQDQHDGRAQQRQARGHACGLLERSLPHRQVGIHQGSQQTQQGDQDASCGEQ
jgi:hypothetical protein